MFEGVSIGDIVFWFFASPWTFLAFGVLWIGVSVAAAVRDVKGNTSEFAMLVGVLCLGFAAVLWKLH